MTVTRDREEGTITISQKGYTEDVVQRYGMKGCIPTYTPGVMPKLSLNQQEETLLNEKEKRRYQEITRAVRLSKSTDLFRGSSNLWRRCGARRCLARGG